MPDKDLENRIFGWHFPRLPDSNAELQLWNLHFVAIIYIFAIYIYRVKKRASPIGELELNSVTATQSNGPRGESEGFGLCCRSIGLHGALQGEWLPPCWGYAKTACWKT